MVMVMIAVPILRHQKMYRDIWGCMILIRTEVCHMVIVSPIRIVGNSRVMSRAKITEIQGMIMVEAMRSGILKAIPLMVDCLVLTSRRLCQCTLLAAYQVIG